MQDPSQEHPVSSEAPGEDLQDMDALPPLKSRYRDKIQNMGLSKTSDHIKSKIKMQTPSEEPPASFKAQNQELKDMYFLCTFKIKIESSNLEHGCIKDQWLYPNQDQDPKP